LWAASTLLVGCMARLEERAPGGEDEESGGDTGDVLIGPSSGSGSSTSARPVASTGVNGTAGSAGAGGPVVSPGSAVTQAPPSATDAGLPAIPPPGIVIPVPTQPPWAVDASVQVQVDPGQAVCSGLITRPAGAWLPHPGFGADIQALFDHTKDGIVGVWHGLASTPWIAPYEVDLEFRVDGSYSGRCTRGSDVCCVAFYYGTDRDSPRKRYRVQDATLSGNVIGQIDIDFGFALAGWQGELSQIELDASGNGLSFDFARDDGYGPVKYDLRRVK